MPKVLRPRLEGFGIQLSVIGDLNQRVPKEVRIKIRQSRPRTGFAENLANRVCVGPRRAIERDRAECEVVARRDLSFREQRIVGSESLFVTKESNPVHHDLPDVVSDRKEPCREGLRPLGANLARVLLNQAAFDIDVLQAERNDRLIAGA